MDTQNENNGAPKLKFATPADSTIQPDLCDADKAKLQEALKAQAEERRDYEEKMGRMQYLAAMQIIIALNGSTAENDKFLKAEDMDALVRKYGLRAAALKAAVLTFFNATLALSQPMMPQAPQTIVLPKEQVPQ